MRSRNSPRTSRRSTSASLGQEPASPTSEHAPSGGPGDDDYRNTYARAPGWEDGRLPAEGGPHGGFIDLYINDVMEDAIAEGMPIERWPEGSIIVKDGWNSAEGGTFEYLSFMERREGGWFWGEYKGNGRFVSAGKNDETCIGCHSSGEDQVRAFELPPQEE